MLNYIIMYGTAAALLLSVVAVITEKAAPHQRVLRALRNFLRGISLTEVITASVIFIIIGLLGDDINFSYIWGTIALLFVMLALLLPPRMRLKKVKKLEPLPILKELKAAAVSPTAKELKTADEAPKAKEIKDVNEQ